MALLTCAYQTLSDPEQRKKFDTELEIYNTDNNDQRAPLDAGRLPSAGLSFSEDFRKQDANFIKRYQKRPLPRTTDTDHLKAFRTDLYRDHLFVERGESAGSDLFSVLRYKTRH